MLELKRRRDSLAANVLAPRWTFQLDEHPAALGVTRDGARVIAGHLGGELLSLDAATGAVRARWVAHPAGLNCATLTADGLASGGEDGVLRLWGVDGAQRTEHKVGAQWLEQIAVSADGRLIAAAAGRELLVCASDGTERVRHTHTAPIRALAFSPNAGLLALGGNGGAVLLRTQDGAVDRRYANKSPLLSLAFSPDARVLASGTGDNQCLFWRLSSNEPSQMAGFQGPPFKPMALAWNGSTLASGGDQSIALWKFSGKGPEGRQPDLLHGHWDLVTHLAYSHDGAWLASGGRDGALMLTEIKRLSAPRLGAELEGECCALAWHPHKPLLVVADSTGRVAAFDVRR